MLEKVERVTTDVLVAEKLKQWIIENKAQPGDRMPTEQVLSQELGVARHTLREGIKRLSQLGIIDSRTGSGIYVNEANFDIFAEYIRFLEQTGYITEKDICRVRTLLETSIAAEAAKAIDEEHLEMLRQLTEQMQDSCERGDFDEYVTLDIRFHLTIAEATENHLLKGIVSALREVIISFMNSLDDNTMENSNSKHREIVAALERRDAAQAALKMGEHLGPFEADSSR